MKITLRSANLIDLITSQGRLRFLATHTQSHLGDPGILKNKETLDFPFYFLIITRSSLKCCLPPKELKNFRALSMNQNESRATKRLPTLLHCARQHRF